MLLQQLVDFRVPSDSADDATAGRPYSRQRKVRWQLNVRSNDLHTSLVELSDSSQRTTMFGRPMLVPNGGRTSGIAPCLGADDAQYILGWADEKSKKERVNAAHAAFIALAKRWLSEYPDEAAAQTVAALYDRGTLPPPPVAQKWSSKDLVMIAVDYQPVTELDSLWSVWQDVVRERKSGAGADGGGRQGTCLVCGNIGTLLDRMPQALPKILVPRAEQEVALVSANRRIHTYDFTEGLAGSPICVECGQRSVANLHTILSSDDRYSFTYSRQRTKLAWWVTNGADDRTIALLDERPDTIRDYLRSITTGKGQRHRSNDAQFCSMTLSGNVARLVVHRWIEMPLADAEANVRVWFEDHQIVPRGQDNPTGYPIWILVSCAGQWVKGDTSRPGRYIPLADKAADRPDDLAQLLLHSALDGTVIPQHMLAHVVRRIRTDLRIDGPRAALLRVALNRHPQPAGEGPAAVLDEKQDNPAYLYGRLFAVLESLQRRAYPGDDLPNATFFSRYFPGAVANPRVALTQGLQLYPAWLKKLDNTARDQSLDPTTRQRHSRAATRFRARLRELYDRLGEPVRPLADAESQSWFTLGYFHQQAHDVRMARAGKAPEVPLDSTTTDDTDLDEGNDHQ